MYLNIQVVGTPATLRAIRRWITNKNGVPARFRRLEPRVSVVKAKPPQRRRPPAPAAIIEAE